MSNENAILNTIKSRCIKIYFEDIKEEELKNYIKNNLNLSEFNSNMLKAATGSIGKAIDIYKNKEIYLEIDDIFRNIEKYHLTDVMSKLEVLYKNKDNIVELLEYINTIFIDKAKEENKYLEYISCVEEAKKNIKQNCNFDMCIDKLLFSIWR